MTLLKYLPVKVRSVLDPMVAVGLEVPGAVQTGLCWVCLSVGAAQTDKFCVYMDMEGLP